MNRVRRWLLIQRNGTSRIRVCNSGFSCQSRTKEICNRMSIIGLVEISEMRIVNAVANAGITVISGVTDSQCMFI